MELFLIKRIVLIYLKTLAQTYDYFHWQISNHRNVHLQIAMLLLCYKSLSYPLREMTV